jgi:hypothetical protein
MHHTGKDKHKLRVKGCKTIFQANWIQKQAGVALLTFGKADFKAKLVKRHKEGHFILVKGKIHQETKIIVIIYALKCIAHNFIKQTFLDKKYWYTPTQ